ncbi:uncharacterized protein [Branchiostoma lanceolatum]|uniref:uncharacterized protein n=1 Tax=Branchiostoma lanceolatum TaxID=7740 RepID=UPI0034561078
MGTTDVREVTLVKAVSTLDGKVPTQTAPGQKCCGCSKVPVCSSSNCNCRKAGKVCGTKCKCAKKHLDCKNKNSVEVQNNCSTAVPRSSLAHSWRKVDLYELSRGLMLMEGGTPDVLQQRAQTAGLMFREPTPKDGNCFFWAINDQLQRDALRKEGAKTMYQGDIREAVTCYIKDHPKTTNGESIVAFTAERSLDEYLAKMSQNGSWADHIYVQAIADFLKRTIHIVSTSGGEDGCFICVEPIGGESEGTPLLLGHYAERHYQSLDTTAALGSSPSPLQGSSPSPLQGSSPSPLQGSSPSPLQGSSPSPLQGSSPSPLQGSSPSPLHDDEVSIAMRYHSLLGPESIGDTPPVRRRQSENGDM